MLAPFTTSMALGKCFLWLVDHSTRDSQQEHLSPENPQNLFTGESENNIQEHFHQSKEVKTWSPLWNKDKQQHSNPIKATYPKILKDHQYQKGSPLFLGLSSHHNKCLAASDLKSQGISQMQDPSIPFDQSTREKAVQMLSSIPKYCITVVYKGYHCLEIYPSPTPYFNLQSPIKPIVQPLSQ